MLSDAIEVRPSASYRVESRMRFNLDSAPDSVQFAVIQYDSSGREIMSDRLEALDVDGVR